jgi:hypothetical protein
MPDEQIRVFRILEYTGPREWVEETLDTGSVPQNGEWFAFERPNGMRIRSATIGTWADLFNKLEGEN